MTRCKWLWALCASLPVLASLSTAARGQPAVADGEADAAAVSDAGAGVASDGGADAAPVDAAVGPTELDAAGAEAAGDAAAEDEASSAADASAEQAEAPVFSDELDMEDAPDAAPPMAVDPPVEPSGPEPVEPVPPVERPALVVKTILGLLALLALAYVGGHPRVQRWERKIGVTQFITAGFPFVALGLVASLPSVGILTERVLADLGPVLRFGLGWIGFVAGFRFDARSLEALPSGVAGVLAKRVTIAFLAIMAALALFLLAVNGLSRGTFARPVFLRDAVILAAAGVVSARAAAPLEPGSKDVDIISVIVRVEELAAIVGLTIVAAYFRVDGGEVTWQLPGTAWLLLTVGMGSVLGVVIYALMMLETTSSVEYIVLTLGSVAFAAGMAGNLRLSPVVVCFVAGVLLANFPGPYKKRLREMLTSMERPIYLVFLMVVGAAWRAADVLGWILMIVFVLARLGGKWVGTNAPWGGVIDIDPRARKTLVFAPMGALAVAIVVSAGMLYPGRSISAIVTAVLGGAIVGELLIQRALRSETPVDATPLPVTRAPEAAEHSAEHGGDGP